MPAALGRWCQQRLGRRREPEVPSEIDDEQPIAVAEEPERERLRPQHRSVQSTALASADHGILAAQREEIGVEADGPRVTLALAGIELAALERRAVARIGQPGHHRGRGEAGELREKFGSALPHERRQLGRVIGEEEPGRRGAELLPLEQQRRLGNEQQERGHRAEPAGVGELVQALAASGVRDLIVVL